MLISDSAYAHTQTAFQKGPSFQRKLQKRPRDASFSVLTSQTCNLRVCFPGSQNSDGPLCSSDVTYFSHFITLTDLWHRLYFVIDGYSVNLYASLCVGK
jgi:hypothetical protein